MGSTYKRVNQASTSSGGGGGSGTPYSEVFSVASWSGPTSGFYTYTVLAIDHDKGTSPGVQLFELDGAVYGQVEAVIEINGSGDVEVKVPSLPDNRFDGKIVILD
jgi:hypothetical protein